MPEARRHLPLVSKIYKTLYVAAPNDFGGNYVILFKRDDGRAFGVAAEDSLMIELEETPAEGLRWHVLEAPPGFIIHSDEWIDDGTFTKKGTRRVKNQLDPLTRRIIMNIDYGAEEGDVTLVLAPTDLPYDEFGFVQILLEEEVKARWSVEIDSTDVPAREQLGLPGRGKGQPFLHEVAVKGSVRERLSPLAERACMPA